jgi:uncharacterized membrane protein
MKKMKIFQIQLLLLTSLSFQLSSCGFRHIKSHAVEDNAKTEQISLTTPASFDEIQKKIIGPKCLQCHSDFGGNKAGVNLESFEQVEKYLNGIKQRSLVDLNMPPSEPLSKMEQSLLQSWINKEFSGKIETKETTPVKMIVKWQKIKNEIIDKHCLICHSPPTTEASGDKISTMEAGLDLSSLDVVREKADLIFKRAIILHDMPLQPYPPLNEQEKMMLSQWMIEGMAEDIQP